MNRWFQIGRELTRLVEEASPEDLYLVIPTTKADRVQFASGKILLEMESSFAQEIDRAIDAWNEGASFQWPSDECKKCFFYRTQAAASFAMLHSTVAPSAADLVFPDPVCTSEIAIRHLLKDWWYTHGCQEQAMSMLAGI